MKKINAIIIEDDNFNILAVSKIIEKHFPEITIVDTASRVNESVDKIRFHQPDLLLMDIHLTDGTSFDVIRQCREQNFKIVFMSAYHEYVIKAVQYAAVDFVFKPFDINDMVVAIDKAIDQLQDDNYQLKIETLFNNVEQNQNQIILQGRDKLRACNVDEIAWGKAIQGGANFYMLDNSYFFVTKPLRRYEAMLSDFTFFRCHPHYLINLNHVTELKSDVQRLKMRTGDEVIYENRRFHQLTELLEHNKEYA
ncbi:response regulator transcription factor [Carboxylicivirga sp. A043]|uniref:LytR/AlgR family response regulator transcription factor n=1 Tax=Carboxylicivirga litoralis TaxID=2816963 RepID=UPI0021CB39E2|nr:LytTR family DNA-binding domain-containing protein [Carboxylicivirga sp. A043]MCU4157094.1 response regulator transcription factor [Carboxylicivirga sp. A043]